MWLKRFLQGNHLRVHFVAHWQLCITVNNLLLQNFWPEEWVSPKLETRIQEWRTGNGELAKEDWQRGIGNEGMETGDCEWWTANGRKFKVVLS